MIDICDFAVGLSRQLYGRTMPSERPGHRLMETWHPLGVVGVDLGVQLPGRGVGLERRPRPRLRRHRGLEAVREDAAHRDGVPRALLDRAAARGRRARRTCTGSCVADAAGGAALVDSPPSPLVSATGSERMGARGRARGSPRASAAALLELGGNNAAIVTPSADLDLAVRGIVFAAAGTAGQRCTTMRRSSCTSPRRRAASSGWPRVYAAAVGDPFEEGTSSAR